MATGAPPPASDEQPWRRRLMEVGSRKTLKDAVRLHLRQLPCLHSLLPNIRCWKRSRYQNLGQDEEGDGAEVEDHRQDVNLIFGKVLIRLALFNMVGLTILFMIRNRGIQGGRGPDFESMLSDEEAFSRDSPIVLYLGALELLVCGACAQTAALMYHRRRHALRHPADSTGRERQGYIKVELEKDAGLEHRQLYGLGFRPSTDGLECLIVEAVRPGSLVDQWNRTAVGPSPQQLLEEALGVDGAEEEAQAAQAPPAADAATAQPAPAAPRTVRPGAAVVAVNDVAADVGLMQVQLTRPKVTLWLHTDLTHPSQLESEMLSLGPLAPQPPPGSAAMPGAASPDGGGAAGPAPTFLGRPETGGFGAAVVEAAVATAGPRCACIALEDEEQQILMRWAVCSLIFGWVTMLPVLLMQPHDQRPRQKLFRQYLLKPCLFVLPIAMLLWTLDCVEVLAQFQIMRPIHYFGACHIVIPAILVFYLVSMQAADEKLVLEQRKARQAEAVGSPPLAVEDPVPALFKELIEINPVALVWLGSSASIPLVLFSMITPMQTARAKMAQGYVHAIYIPCALLQVGFVWVLWRVRFIDLPRLYLAGIGLLLSVPCFLVWCICLCCASKYSREDMQLVERQRLERAKEALAAGGPVPPEAILDGAPGSLVDCTEAMRDGMLVYTA